MEYYWSKVGNPDFYPEKLIVLDNEKIVSINQSLGLLTFIDKDGGLSEPIKIVKIRLTFIIQNIIKICTFMIKKFIYS